MKHLFNILPKLTAIAAIALSASSCNRAEYAMLPKTTPYHDTQRTVAVKPAPSATPVSPETAAPVMQETVVPEMAAPVAAKQQAPAAQRPANTVAKATAPAKTAASKLNLAQKALVHKLAKKADKLTAKTHFSKKSEAASEEDANALSRNIKLGIILILIGLLLGIFGGVIGVLGGIVALIGVVLIILGLLDEV